MRLIDRAYCAYQKKDVCTWLADTAADITPDFCPDSASGSMVLCIAEGSLYVKNCAGKWQKFGTSEVI